MGTCTLSLDTLEGQTGCVEEGSLSPMWKCWRKERRVSEFRDDRRKDIVKNAYYCRPALEMMYNMSSRDGEEIRTRQPTRSRFMGIGRGY